MSEHLKMVTGIFARESSTIQYLEAIGVTKNVYSVADSAFLMDPVKPEGIEKEVFIDKEAIGLNLSPLMAKYVTDGNLKQWIKVATQIILGITETTEMPVYLIPHVTSPHSNDYAFMQRAVSKLEANTHNITLIPPKYNAAETKWIISRMAFFAGARTHSIIAALSSGVPTLSFSYSIKAKGINSDVFGHTNYSLDSMELSAKEVANRFLSVLDNETQIKKDLYKRIPEVQKVAMNAGINLKQLIGMN